MACGRNLENGRGLGLRPTDPEEIDKMQNLPGFGLGGLWELMHSQAFSGAEKPSFTGLLGGWVSGMTIPCFRFLTNEKGGNIMRAWVSSQSDPSSNPAWLCIVGFGASVP